MKKADGNGPSRDGDDDAKAASLKPSRRQFLKGLTTGTVAIGALTQSGCAPAVPPLKTRGATNTTTVCPFCGVGCGQVVSSRGGKVIHIEGDPGHRSPARVCGPIRCSPSPKRSRS